MIPEKRGKVSLQKAPALEAVSGMNPMEMEPREPDIHDEVRRLISKVRKSRADGMCGESWTSVGSIKRESQRCA